MAPRGSYLAAALLPSCILALIPQELLDSCIPYYNACIGDTDCNNSYDAADGSCSQSGVENKAYAMCFMNFDTTTSEQLFENLELCLYEQALVLEGATEYSCYKNGNEAAECLPEFAQIVFKNGDGEALPQLELGSAIPKNTEWLSYFEVNWGDLPVIPDPTIDCRGGCVNLIKIPHMNLHGCRKTALQTSCSVLLLEQTDSDGVGEIKHTQEFIGYGQSSEDADGDYEFRIQFDEAGEWWLLTHVRLYVNNTDTGVYTKWDIGKTLKVNVVDDTSNQSASAAAVTIIGLITAMLTSLF